MTATVPQEVMVLAYQMHFRSIEAARDLMQAPAEVQQRILLAYLFNPEDNNEWADPNLPDMLPKGEEYWVAI